MAHRIQTLLPWRIADADGVTDTIDQALRETPPNGFPELMAAYRQVVPALRPLAVSLAPETRARIDGLIMAALVLDGWLETPARLQAGKPPRIPEAELQELRVDQAHFDHQTVDFAWRRLTERYGRRVRDLLKGAAVLGKPWVGGLRYRFAIARMEQILRAIQVDPVLAYRGIPRLTALAMLRIVWRTLSKRR